MPAEPRVPVAEVKGPWPWPAFVRAYLPDYTSAARRLWLSITLCGGVAMVWAVQATWSHGPDAWPVVLAMVAAAVASMMPVRIPRSNFSLSTADLCIYVTLATLGPAAAVLAAGADGTCGAWRVSRRLSSRVATPAAAMAAVALGGLASEALRPALTALAGEGGALMVCLGVMAAAIFVGTTLPLTALVDLKRGRPVVLREWFVNCAWVGAMSMAAALLAGLVVLNARLFGPQLIGAAVVLAAVSVSLLRVSMARQEAQQVAQESRLQSARRQAEINQQRFTAAFSHAAVGMAIVGADGRALQVNRAMGALLGMPETDLVARDFQRFLHPDDVPLLERLLRDLSDRPEETFSVQLRCLRRDGEELWVALHCGRFDDPGADPETGPETGTDAERQAAQCVIYQVHDITSRHLAEQRLQHIAFHDSLTDLANRACFIERLGLAAERARRQGEGQAGAHFAVMFLDLDRFKVINDSLGHQAGNELLCRVAERLRNCVRPRDLVARLGGDEFAVLCEGLADQAAAQAMAERLKEGLSRPLSIQGTEVVPGASIGITFSDRSERSVDDILRDADLAMYEAKGAGRGRIAVFDASMHERIADRLALESDLRHAVGEGRLSAVFQPINDLRHDHGAARIVAFEALARWVHPERGPIDPGVFIGLAEDSGHIEAVTRWMLDHALGHLARWRQAMPELGALQMHVNISGRDLADPTLAADVRAALQRHGVPPGLLTLEITETMLMSRLETALTTLNALRELGVRCSIDDFGTGYSSLAYLSQLPIDSLKIDRSFVIGMASGPQNVEIIRTVLELGHTLGKVVVAEGVETNEQLEALQRMGVDCAQGYLLSPPLPAEKADMLLMGTLPMLISMPTPIPVMLSQPATPVASPDAAHLAPPPAQALPA